MRPPIYEPRGAAKEYGDYALNIYTGCPHRCYYCFAPGVLHKDREAFHSNVEPRPGIVEEVRKQLEREQITGKTIHLCFTCDPYPTGYDSTATREIIKLLKEHGNHVQILTKGDGSRDFDLLDENDWYGITIDGVTRRSGEHGGMIQSMLSDVYRAKCFGIQTWCSFEPVVEPDLTLYFIKAFRDRFDKVKIGKLNYCRSAINWAQFGREAEELCQSLGLNYYIKDSLRREMEAAK